MSDYKRLKTDACIELIINKSKFLGYAYVAEDADTAERLIASLRKPHSTATHICYGYIADTLGNVARFSDDGEPQGTAGMPILDVLKKQELRQSLVVVVRYFGGVKLGAGGLVRAYSSAAVQAIEAAGITVIKERVRLALSVDYSDHTRMNSLLAGEGITIENRTFADRVELELSVDKLKYEDFVEGICSLLGLGRDIILKDIVKLL